MPPTQKKKTAARTRTDLCQSRGRSSGGNSVVLTTKVCRQLKRAHSCTSCLWPSRAGYRRERVTEVQVLLRCMRRGLRSTACRYVEDPRSAGSCWRSRRHPPASQHPICRRNHTRHQNQKSAEEREIPEPLSPFRPTALRTLPAVMPAASHLSASTVGRGRN